MSENKENTPVKCIKIKHMTIQNVKAVNCIDYELPLSGVTTFGGRNNQGKSTALSAAQYTLGGEGYRPTNYRKENAVGETFTDILLTEGIRVCRIGETADLKVIDENGKLQGQTLLNKFISKMALDFPKFINGTDKERRDILLTALNLKEQVDAIEDVIEAEYGERTVIGRIADQKEKAVKEMPYYEGVPANELSSADVIKRLREVEVRNAKVIAAKQDLEKLQQELVGLVESSDEATRNRQKLAADLEAFQKRNAAELDATLQSIEQKIASLKAEAEEAKKTAERRQSEYQASVASQQEMCDKRIAKAAEDIETLTDRITEAEKADFTLEDTSSFQKELDSIEETNHKVRINKERDRATEEAIEQRRKYDEKTAIIEEKRKELDALLVGADLPYPGLSVVNRVIHLDGKAWDCMSESMKIRVGCAIVARINPSCKFMLVDKLEQLDSESLAELDQFAKDHDIQIIGTRVTTDPNDCSIIIKNGWIEGMEGKMFASPQVSGRRASKKKAETAAAAEAKPSAVAEPKSEEVVSTAMVGGETDAMKRAKEILARKRAQIFSAQQG